MWNLSLSKLMVVLGIAGVGCLFSMPAKAQQVVLTPAGTFAMQPKTMEEVMGLAPGSLQPTVSYVDVLNEETAKSRNVLQETYPTQQEFVNQLRSKAQFILDNPGFITATEPVAEVLDAQGKVLYTREQVIEQLRVEAANVLRAPETYGIRTGSSVQTVSPSVVVPGEVTPVVSQSLPSLPPVTVQASQNPTADFAPTRSAPRNTVPDQLNQGIINSPLSSSRIFPGMR
jgi:hypothetical protein